MFIFIATLVGVVFFSGAANEIVAVGHMTASGGGVYRPRRRKNRSSRGHILVMGNGLSAHTRDSVECFLKMLCREPMSSGAAVTPDIVLLAEHVSDDVKATCSEPWAQKFHVRREEIRKDHS